VKTLLDAGEPMSEGRRPWRDPGPLELGDVLTLAAIIVGVVLANGIVALVLIEAFGWWPEPASEGSGDAAREVSARLRGPSRVRGLIPG
jgi:hypothetical protein